MAETGIQQPLVAILQGREELLLRALDHRLFGIRRTATNKTARHIGDNPYGIQYTAGQGDEDSPREQLDERTRHQS